MVLDNVQTANHGVASISIGSDSSHLGGDGHSLGEGESDVTETFCATYMSLPMHIVNTVANGDCGLDVMCLTIGWRRCKQHRDVLRYEMAAFALKHVGNRASIAMLHSVGGLTTHLGLFELGSAGVEMFVGAIVELAVSSALEVHRGYGGRALVDAGTLEAAQRNFSDEETRDVIRKVRFHKSSLACTNELVRCLPLGCIKQTVDEYQNRATEEAQKDTRGNVTCLVSRDAWVHPRLTAARSFLQWCEEKHCQMTPQGRQQLKCGNIHYGWFPAYVRSHPSLRNDCRLSDRATAINKAQSVNILGMYSRDVQQMLSEHAAVAEGKHCAVAKPADDGSFAKFNNHPPMIGRQYFSSPLLFKWDSQRRISSGAGRHRGCGGVREMMAMLYSIVRHSVEVNLMCLFAQEGASGEGYDVAARLLRFVFEEQGGSRARTSQWSVAQGIPRITSTYYAEAEPQVQSAARSLRRKANDVLGRNGEVAEDVHPHFRLRP